MKPSLLATLLLILPCHAALAQQVVDVLTETGIAIPGGSPLDNLDNVPQFNPDLGQLAEVEVSFTGVLSQTVGAEALNSPVPVAYSLENAADYIIRIPGESFDEALGPTTYDLSGTLPRSGSLYDTRVTTVDFDQTFDNPTLLAEFSGNGALEFFADTKGEGSAYTVGDNGRGGGFATATLDQLTVKYFYAQIPEPCSCAALLGLLALAPALLRGELRRRRAS